MNFNQKPEPVHIPPRCPRCYVSPLFSNGLCRKCDALVPCARPGCGKIFDRHRLVLDEHRFAFRPYGAPADTCPDFVHPVPSSSEGGRSDG